MEEISARPLPSTTPSKPSISWFSISTLLELTASAFGLAIRLLVILISLLSIVTSATVLYWAFYWMVIPKAFQTLPVHFDYSQSAPRAIVSLTHQQYQLDELVRFYHKRETDLLEPYEKYDVLLEFDGFQTPLNQRCGILSFTSEIYGSISKNETKALAKSTRPLTPYYRSPPVWLTRKLLLSVPLLLGWVEESTSHSLVVFEEYFETTRFKTSHLSITLHGDPFHVRSASLKFYIKLQGVRWVLYHYFFTSAFVGISQISFAIFFLLVFGYYYFFVVETNEFRDEFVGHPDDEDLFQDMEFSEEEEEEEFGNETESSEQKQ